MALTVLAKVRSGEGVAKALELFWSSESIDATEALRIGLVNRVFDDDKLAEAAPEHPRSIRSFVLRAGRMGRIPEHAE